MQNDIIKKRNNTLMEEFKMHIALIHSNLEQTDEGKAKIDPLDRNGWLIR